MTKAEHRRFIRELSGSVVKELLADVAAGKLPPEWNGIELRALIADRFQRCAMPDLLKGRRLRDYRNTLYINNL